MNFDHLDDPAPPFPADLDSVVAVARRRVRTRRLAGAGGAMALVLTAGGVALAVRDSDDSIPIVPADTTSTTAPIESDGNRVAWSEDGLDFAFSLDYPQAVVGGPVRASLTVTNPGDEPATMQPLCGGDPAALEIHHRDGRPIHDTYAYPDCLPALLEIQPGDARVHMLEATIDDLAGGPALGEYDVVLVGQGTDVSLPVGVVEPRASSEVVVDTTLGTGQVVDATLVVHNELDALVPFPGPGATCPDLYIQTQFVTPGDEPEPFAWPDYDCDPKPALLLLPGRNEVAHGNAEAPAVAGEYELVADLGYAWPDGITPPPRLAVTVEQSGEPELVVEWTVEPT